MLGCRSSPAGSSDRLGFGRDDVRLEVVEVELRGVPTCSIARWAFWTFGRPTWIWSSPSARDLGLGDAERVDALADDLDRAVDVLGRDLGVCGVGRPW